MNKRAYYTALRLGLLEDSSNGEVLHWQKENYRSLSTDDLFLRLKRKGIEVNKSNFLQLTEPFFTPEDFSDVVLADLPNELEYDQAYLVIFELWRRLCPEKQSISIFCDELDHLIELYDEEKLKSLESLQDSIDHLQIIIEENGDSGGNREEIFQKIADECANVLEDFLYDFSYDQLELGNTSYAAELVDKFREYVPDSKWFELLHLRLLLLSNQPFKENIQKLVSRALKETDIDFNFDLLYFLARTEEKDLFKKIFKKTIPLLETEGDYQDLLAITQEYFINQDIENGEEILEQVLDDRKHIPLTNPINPHDKSIKMILSLIS